MAARIVKDENLWPLESGDYTSGLRIVVYDDGTLWVTHLDRPDGPTGKLYESTPYIARPDGPFYSYHDCPYPPGLEIPPPKGE